MAEETPFNWRALPGGGSPWMTTTNMGTGSHQLVMANRKGTLSSVEEAEPLATEDAANRR